MKRIPGAVLLHEESWTGPKEGINRGAGLVAAPLCEEHSTAGRKIVTALQCAAVMHESDADLNQKHLMHNVAGSITFAKMSPDSRLSHVLIVNLLSSEERAGPQRQTCRFWCSLANAS